MATAGRAVLLSGLTVAIGLIALVVLPVPGLRSVGYGGMLIPLVSTARGAHAAARLLGGIGPRVDWPRVRHEPRPAAAGPPGRAASCAAAGSPRRRGRRDPRPC